MTSRQVRRERREAERKEKKAEFKRLKTSGQEPIPAPVSDPGFVSQPTAPPLNRAEINRANAQYSTGPRTPVGKLASSRNSLKHGLASGEMIIPGEDPAVFEALLRDLLEDHQPAAASEELLVKEMAQSWWLTQRALRFQNECFTENGVDEKRLALFLRYQTTHDRAFHKALNTLTRLKQSRARQQAIGFVSQRPAVQLQFVRQNDPIAPETGFVPQNHVSESPPETRHRR